jgi:hypothetical protein
MRALEARRVSSPRQIVRELQEFLGTQLATLIHEFIAATLALFLGHRCNPRDETKAAGLRN